MAVVQDASEDLLLCTGHARDVFVLDTYSSKKICNAQYRKRQPRVYGMPDTPRFTLLPESNKVACDKNRQRCSSLQLFSCAVR